MFPEIYRLSEKLQAQMGVQERSRIRNLYWDSPVLETVMAGAHGDGVARPTRWEEPLATARDNNFAMGKIKRALVVEGGGMRGAHSSGALNALRDHGLTFDIVTGSSAGSANAAYWVDGYERMDLAWRNHMHGDRFIRYRNPLLGKPLMNLDFLFYEIFKNIFPLHMERINETSLRFFITVTDCETGQPYYVENKPHTDILGALFAGAAMPFGYPLPVRYGDRPSADGGITDSIPFQKALDHGANDLWIILTRPKGFRKSAGGLMNPLNRWKFGEYPALVEAMKRRSEMYNDQIATVERLETEGKATVIRPSPGLKMHRLQRNQAKLHEAIDQGYQDALLVLKETGIIRG